MQWLRAESPKAGQSRVFTMIEVGVRGFPVFRASVDWHLSRGLAKEE